MAGYLTNVGGAAGIDFTNATQQFYAVTSTPKAAWSGDARPYASNLAARLASAVGGVVKAAPAILESGTSLTALSTCLGQAFDFADAKPGAKVTLDEFRRAMSTSGGCASAAVEAGAKNSTGIKIPRGGTTKTKTSSPRAGFRTDGSPLRAWLSRAGGGSVIPGGRPPSGGGHLLSPEIHHFLDHLLSVDVLDATPARHRRQRN